MNSTRILLILTLIMLSTMLSTRSYATCPHRPQIETISSKLDSPSVADGPYRRALEALVLALEENCTRREQATGLREELKTTREERAQQAQKAADCQNRASACERRLEALTVPSRQSWRASWWVRIGLDGLLVSSGAAAGVLIVSDVPEGLRWSAVTVAAGTLIVRVAIEIAEN